MSRVINGFEIDVYNQYGLKEGDKTSTCPKCSADRKKSKEKCLSLDWERGLGTCQHCGEVIQLHSYKRKKSHDRVYIKPNSDIIDKLELSEKTLNYIQSRGISKNTIRHFKIKDGVVDMPDKDKGAWVKRNAIHIPYEITGELINIKYRDAKKNFKMHKGSERVLYNLDSIIGLNEAIFLEGEFEVWSSYEVGVKNCVSVPNGATLKRNNLEYLDNCIDIIEGIDKYILGFDNDEAGEELKKEFIRRLGAENCYVINYKDCKDGNEFLLKYGADAYRDILLNPEPVPLENVSTVKDHKERLEDIVREGFKKGFVCGIDNFDSIFSTYTSQFLVVTGIPSCFSAEQEIVTNSGTKKISEINIGDYVLSYNLDLHRKEYKKVLRVLVNRSSQDKLLRIKLKDGTEIKVTHRHKFFHNGEYIEINKILPILKNNREDISEIFKPIPNYSLYEISNFGRIKTYNWKNQGIEAIMKPAKDKNGYLRTSLKRDIDGKIHPVKVHRLVASAFLEKPEGCNIVNHLNGITSDNDVRNLEWTTSSGNNLHSSKRGNLGAKGERNQAATLSNFDVELIRSNYIYGKKSRHHSSETKLDIANRYGVNFSAIKQLVQAKSWKYCGANTIDVRQIESWEEIPMEDVYDLTVEENHNYYLKTKESNILVSNSGKSDFVDEMCLGYNNNYGWKIAYASPENQPLELHTHKLVRKIWAKMPTASDLGTEEWARLIDKIERNIFFIDMERYTLDSVLKKGAELVKRKGIRVLVIDPFNKVRDRTKDGKSEDNINKYTMDYLTKIDDFCKKYDVLVVIVAHPNKMYVDRSTNKFPMPTFYDIKGGGEWYDASYHGLVVHRDYEMKTTTVKVLKVKFQNLGENGAECQFTWDSESGKFIPYSSPLPWEVEASKDDLHIEESRKEKEWSQMSNFNSDFNEQD